MRIFTLKSEGTPLAIPIAITHRRREEKKHHSKNIGRNKTLPPRKENKENGK